VNKSKRYLEIAKEYASELRRRSPLGVRDILLYGSVARGDATEASDIDVLVVLDGGISQVVDNVREVAADMMDKYNTLISILECGPGEYQRLLRFPFGWQITKEAVSL
jgi:predicted nucleotidyltransferase